MPKAAKYQVTWSEVNNNYELRYPDGKVAKVGTIITPEWSEWLQICPSFSFNGKNGNLNLLKEKRGEDVYGYAYRRQGPEVIKKYAGRISELSLNRLEELAEQLKQTQTAKKNLVVDESVPPKVVPQSVKFDSALLLTPKLNLPHLHADLIPRQRLLNWLDSALQRKLTIIAAPAGYGKTTLVRQWLESWTKRDVPQNVFPTLSWLSLDASDNDLSRFWHYFIAACQAFQSGLGEHALATLQTFTQLPFEPQSWENILVSLLNELSQVKNGGLLVLEDFHNITSPYINDNFAFLIDHLPPQFHLIIIGRTAPLLPLTRWRAKNELGELNRNDLRFLPNETKLFLEQNLEQTLTSEAIKRLDQKLEGWAVGLRLIALTLHGRLSSTEVTKYLENFEISNQRTILEYFVSEVLKAQPPDLQDFLLRTSLLDDLNGLLCQVVTNRADSHIILEYLASTNLFLEVSDAASQWYRYHALFAEAMRYEARRQLGPSTVAKVLEQAGQWYETQGQLEKAIEIFLEAHQLNRAADLIERFLDNQPRGFIRPVTGQAVRRWAEQLPEEVLNDHPNIQLNYALTLLFVAMTGPFIPSLQTQIEQSLDKAEARFRLDANFPKLGEIMAFRSLLTVQSGDIAVAARCAKQALEWLPPDKLQWRSWSLGVLGGEAFYAGDLATARTRLLEAQAINEAEGNHGYQRANAGMLSAAYGMAGDLQQVSFYVHNILKEAREENDIDDIAHAQIGAAQLSYEWNKLDEAQAEAQEALDLSAQLADLEIETRAILRLARINFVRGQIEAASERINKLLTRIKSQTTSLAYQLYREVKATQTWFYLRTDEIALAEQWRQYLQNEKNDSISLLQQEQEAAMSARVLIAAKQCRIALEMLETILKAAEAGERGFIVLEVKILMALAYFELGELEKASNLIKAAATFAKPQGYVRLFLDEGPSMEKLLGYTLKTLNGERNLANYLKSLVQAFNFNQPQAFNSSQSLTEPLSRQEEKVLRLMVAGQTNPQIANELIVSVNTVRSQVQSIYRKLNVNNRQAASELAKQLHII